MDYIGREHETKLLQNLKTESTSKLVAIYGRRRIGKTTLVLKAYEKLFPIWRFEGLEDSSASTQIKSFLGDLARYSDDQSVVELRATWENFFLALAKKINKKRAVIFFDEFQWTAGMKRSLVSLFKKYWDQYFLSSSGTIFVICGSISSFIVREVIHSKALYGRIDLEIHLKALSLADIYSLLKTASTPPEEVLEYYMILGGVPRYYEIIDQKISLKQNLLKHFFASHGFFVKELKRLLISHFGKDKIYESILLALSPESKNESDLQKITKRKSGGSFSNLLEDLGLADFIEKYSPVDKGRDSKITRYRIYDEYLGFYFYFIRPNLNEIKNNQLEFYAAISPVYKIWSGFAFERLCIKNAYKIAVYLEFSGIHYRYGSWFRNSKEKKDLRLAQVDLLFVRDDRVLTVCEMKYGESLQAQKIIDDFDRKILILEQAYPQYRIQKILILGKRAKVPKRLEDYCSKIIFAHDLFFNTAS